MSKAYRELSSHKIRIGILHRYIVYFDIKRKSGFWAKDIAYYYTVMENSFIDVELEWKKDYKNKQVKLTKIECVPPKRYIGTK